MRDEIDVYNELMPRDGERLDDADRDRRAGAHPPELQCPGSASTAGVAGRRRTAIAAIFEEGRSKEDKLSAVQYVRFRLDDAARADFARPGIEVRLVVEHPNYRAAASIEGAVRASLGADLGLS